MGLFRAEDRLPEDARFLRVASIEQSALFRRRAEYEIGAIVLNEPIFSPEELEQLEEYCRSKVEDSLDRHYKISVFDVSLRDLLLSETSFLAPYEERKETLHKIFIQSSIDGSPAILNGLKKLCEMFENATGAVPFGIYIWINGYPQTRYPHCHGPALTCTPHGLSTIWQDTNNMEHSFPLNRAVIMDNTISHMSPERMNAKSQRMIFIME